MRIDKNNTPFKLASDFAQTITTRPITPHGITKITTFESRIVRKANTPLYNITTSSSPNK